MTIIDEETRLKAASEFWGIPIESLRQLPEHTADCLIGKPHLTCTCGAYSRRNR